MSIMDRSFLNVADICPATRSLGPGLRAALWVQGCPIHCKGCIAPDWIPSKPATIMTPEEAGTRLLQRKDIEGITLSGGEPMIQAEGLTAMVRYIRKKKDLHIICFTGFRYETLLKSDSSLNIKPFIEELDILIDGPYVNHLNNGQSFAGSTNQRIIDLSERSLPGDQIWEPRKMEFHIRNRNILAVGIPPNHWIKDPFKDFSMGQLLK